MENPKCDMCGATESYDEARIKGKPGTVKRWPGFWFIPTRDRQYSIVLCSPCREDRPSDPLDYDRWEFLQTGDPIEVAA